MSLEKIIVARRDTDSEDEKFDIAQGGEDIGDLPPLEKKKMLQKDNKKVKD